MTNVASANSPKSLEDLPVEPTRRERRKLEMRSRVIRTATELFQDQGFEGTRVVDICERADIAQKTFFNHFSSKLDLLREIAHAGIEQLMFEIEDIRNSQPATRDRIYKFFDTAAERITEAGPNNREFLTELVHLVSGDPEERSGQVRRLRDAFTGIVEDGIERGDVTRRHDVEALTELIIGAYYVLIFNYANLEDFPVRERARAAASLVADSLAPRPEETYPERSET